MAELEEVVLELNASHSTMNLTLSLHHFICTVTLTGFGSKAKTQTQRLIIYKQNVFIKLASRICNLTKISKSSEEALGICGSQHRDILSAPEKIRLSEASSWNVFKYRLHLMDHYIDH